MTTKEKNVTVASLVEDFARTMQKKSEPYEKLVTVLEEERRANEILREQLEKERLEKRRVVDVALENEERFKSYIHRLETELKLKLQERQSLDTLTKELMSEIEIQRHDKLKYVLSNNIGKSSSSSVDPDKNLNEESNSEYKVEFVRLAEENQNLKKELRTLKRDLKRSNNYLTKAAATVKIYENLLSNSGLDF